jgi:Tol biopolymer transport system component
MLTMAMAFAATLAAFAQKKDSADVLLGSGLHQEEVEGNCTAAVKTYQKLLQDKNTPRHVAARAQLHIGTCREKLGQSEARAAYEIVISRYSDQSDVAGDARGRLGVLGAKSSLTFRTRFIKFSGFDEMDGSLELSSSVSADGRFIGLEKRTSLVAEVMAYYVTTEESKILERCFLTAKCLATGVHVSPDSRQVAFSWSADPTLDGTFDLRIVSNESGAKARLLLRKPGFIVMPLDWAPNEQSILVAILEMRSGLADEQIGWVSVHDGAFKLVKSFDRGLRISYGRVSPDGKYIAYSLTKTKADSQVYIVAADGSAGMQFTSGGHNSAPIWSPDGGHILFISNRSGPIGLWAASVKDGRPQGNPFSLKPDTGEIAPLGMTRSGSYYYSQERSLVRGDGLNVFEAELDPVTGKQKSPAKYLSESFVGTNTGPSWSPDGKHVAFKRRIPPNAFNNLVVRSMESGEERTYSAPDWTNQQFGFGPGIPTWFHDGSLFIGSEPIPGQPRWLGRMTLEGQYTKLVQIPPQLGWVGAIAPDDKTAYVFSRTTPGSGYTSLVAVDLTNGEEKAVFNAVSGTIMSAAVDSTGRKIAFLSFPNGGNPEQGSASQSKLATVQADGSGYRELYVTSKRMEKGPDQIQWTSDGQNLFFIEDGRVMRISAQGGTPEFTGLGGGTGSNRPFFISLRADNTRIAFSGGAPFSGGLELWALDNLTSLLKSAK